MKQPEKRMRKLLKTLTIYGIAGIYVSTYSYRIGQCIYFNIPVALAPITVTDFLTYVFPALLASPALFLLASKINPINDWNMLLMTPPLLAESAIASIISVNPRYDPLSFVLLTISSIYLLTLLSIWLLRLFISQRKGRHAKTNAKANNSQSLVDLQLLSSALFFVIIIYAYQCYLLLAVSFLATVIYVWKSQSNTEKHTYANPNARNIGGQSYFSRYAFLILIILIAVGLLGYFTSFFPKQYSVLQTETISNVNNSPEGDNAWCMLITSADHTVVCIPAHTTENDQYSACISNEMKIAVIDISNTQCVIEANSCALKKG